MKFPEGQRICDCCGYSAPISKYKHEGRIQKSLCPKYEWMGLLFYSLPVYFIGLVIYVVYANLGPR